MNQASRTLPSQGFPEELADFDGLTVLGSGAFGQVWLVRNRIDEAYYAMKLIPRDLDLEIEGIRIYRQYANEKAFLVPILHIGQIATHFYYTMPLADDIRETMLRTAGHYEAMTLRAYLRRVGRRPVDEVLQVFRPILSALEFLHDRGVIHRDVKLDNVLRIGGDWRLADIGLLAWRGDTLEDFEADIAGLVLIACQLLTDGDEQIAEAFLEGRMQIPDPDQTVEKLRVCFARAFGPDRHLRFANAGEMRRSLDQVLSSPAEPSAVGHDAVRLVAEQAKTRWWPLAALGSAIAFLASLAGWLTCSWSHG